MPTTISVIGLGMMGRPMARRLLAAGFVVRGWNRSQLDDTLVAGIPRIASLADAAQAEICLLMLSDSRAVDAVLAEIEPVLREGCTILDMSTSDPAHSQKHATRLAARGIGWVDAPVSGGPEGAAAGTLAIMAGGNEADIAAVRPVLEILGGNLVHVGGPGMGHTVKLINQLIVGLTIQAVAEGLTLAEKSGVDPRLVQQAVRGGFADSKIMQIHGSRMVERNYTPGARAAIHLKDMQLIMALAESVGAELPHAADVAARYQALVARGEGNLDHSALHKLL